MAALQHQEPDRVPVDLGGTDSSGITAIAYNRLKRHFGINTRTQVCDLIQMIAKVEPEVVRAVGGDTRPVLLEPRTWKPWKLSDGTVVDIPEKARIDATETGDHLLVSGDDTVVARCPSGGIYFDPVHHPLEHIQEPDDVDASGDVLTGFDWADYFDRDYDDLRSEAKALHEETDYAVIGNLCIHLFAACQAHRGFENFMVDLLADKPLARRLMEKQVEAYLPRIEKYAEAVGPYADVILVNDDLGTQNGLQLSPECYREMVKPFHAELWAEIKQRTGKPLLLHSCGAVADLIPDLIEIGVDALNPVQVSAKGMHSGRLKAEFGKDITFWGGGCDTQRILPRGTAAEVKAEVRRRVEDLSAGGGFVFCPVHNIQSDVPIENILAMYEALRAE